jgi:hypothetical protein
VSIAGRIDAKPRIEVMRSAMGEVKLTMAGGLLSAVQPHPEFWAIRSR